MLKIYHLILLTFYVFITGPGAFGINPPWDTAVPLDSTILHVMSYSGDHAE